MTRITITAAVFCIMLPVAVPAAVRAETVFIKGERIASDCRSNSAQAETACNTYIAGALDQVNNSPELQKSVCVPFDTPLIELRRSLGRFAAQHPDEATKSGATLINTMMRTLYPCPVRAP